MDTNMLRRRSAGHAHHFVPRPAFVPLDAVETAMHAGSSADIRDNVVTNVPSVATNVAPADRDVETPDNDIVIEPPGQAQT